jgi:TfoX/Sxy family transcriptional regulator of competence genes
MAKAGGDNMHEGSDEQRAAARELLEEVSTAFVGRPGVTWGRMFANEGLAVRGKIFAVATFGGGLMVKVPEARADELIAAGAVERMVMRGREMREWVVMPIEAGFDEWRELVGEAHAYLDEITP